MTKPSERKVSSPGAAVLWGSALTVATMLAVLLAVSLLIKKELLPQDGGNVIACAAAFAGSLLGGFFTAKQVTGRYALYGAAVGLAVFALRTVAAAVVCHGNFWGGTAFPLLLCLTAGGFLGGSVAVIRPSRRRS